MKKNRLQIAVIFACVLIFAIGLPNIVIADTWIPAIDIHDSNDSDVPAEIDDQDEGASIISTTGSCRARELDVYMQGSMAVQRSAQLGYPFATFTIQNADRIDRPIRKNDTIVLKIHIDSTANRGDEVFEFFNGYSKEEGANQFNRPADNDSKNKGIKVDMLTFYFDDTGDDEADLTLKLTIQKSTEELFGASNSNQRHCAWVTIRFPSLTRQYRYAFIKIQLADEVQPDPTEAERQEASNQFAEGLQTLSYYRNDPMTVYNDGNMDNMIKFFESLIYGMTHEDTIAEFNPNDVNVNLWERYFYQRTTSAERAMIYQWMANNIQPSDMGYQAMRTLYFQTLQDNAGTHRYVTISREAEAEAETYFTEIRSILANLFDKILFRNDNDGQSREAIFHDIFDDISSYIPTEVQETQKVTDKVNVVLSTITSVGMIAAVVLLGILGIKYMIGSVEDKADYKKDMFPYLLGAGLLFAVTAIVKALQLIGQGLNNL